ncbi:MAG: type I-E CRISPR-associated protein Cas6/Cse3/CasE [Pseudomonas sp.]|nr:type I-E CRISPR-associated protein Cas6/Cse3/CasE [Pseudomonas sp.]
MFLSKVTLQSSAQASLELAKLASNGVYSSHQLLWTLFKEAQAREFLYREDMGSAGKPEFIVLSDTMPVADETVLNVQSKSFQPQLSSGQRLGFKLRVNPTVCITDSQGKSKRHDVLMHAKKQLGDAAMTAADLAIVQQQAAYKWIADERRLQSWGIELEALPDMISYEQHKSKKRGGQNVQFSSVDFQGVLTVKEPELFLTQYVKGFGRAKALGCGLMLIRPV